MVQKYCCLPICKNTEQRDRKKGITFHEIPADMEQRTNWVTIIRSVSHCDTWQPHDRSTICSIHFEESCFKEYTKGRRLKPGSLPTIMLTEHRQQQCTHGFTIREIAEMVLNVKIPKCGNDDPIPPVHRASNKKERVAESISPAKYLNSEVILPDRTYSERDSEFGQPVRAEVSRLPLDSGNDLARLRSKSVVKVQSDLQQRLQGFTIPEIAKQVLHQSGSKRGNNNPGPVAHKIPRKEKSLESNPSVKHPYQEIIIPDVISSSNDEPPEIGRPEEFKKSLVKDAGNMVRLKTKAVIKLASKLVDVTDTSISDFWIQAQKIKEDAESGNKRASLLMSHILSYRVKAEDQV